MFVRVGALWTLLLLACSISGLLEAAEPGSLADGFGSVSRQWQETDWVPSSGPRKHYMRPLDDAGWPARMKVLQSAARAGQHGVESTRKFLREGDLAQRALAAQALGFMPAKSAREDLLRAAAEDAEPVVRLYAIDSLGMLGPEAGAIDWDALAEKQKNRDVKRHLSYVKLRGGQSVSPRVIDELVDWDPAHLDSARLGQLAPDFELKSVAGEKVRLSDFRGKKAVVLVFVYGDT